MRSPQLFQKFIAKLTNYHSIGQFQRILRLLMKLVDRHPYAQFSGCRLISTDLRHILRPLFNRWLHDRSSKPEHTSVVGQNRQRVRVLFNIVNLSVVQLKHVFRHFVNCSHTLTTVLIHLNRRRYCQSPPDVCSIQFFDQLSSDSVTSIISFNSVSVESRLIPGTWIHFTSSKYVNLCHSPHNSTD